MKLTLILEQLEVANLLMCINTTMEDIEQRLAHLTPPIDENKADYEEALVALKLLEVKITTATSWSN